ncbi:MAG: nitroreductase family deazaflavin-dependent oxidoreductase, partial [Acidimicrobiia bacterium]|nr:nitroreductase family deazaflavin-dependent oxidoreductase [Acidimicrobiia bacterium]
NPYRALLKWLGRFRWFAVFSRRVIAPLDGLAAKLPFAPTTLGTGLPMGYLTTQGRKSGEWRTVPLLYVDTPDGHAAVVGTNWGDADHPGWVFNLEANTKAKWKITDEHPVRARSANDLEFMSLWPQFVEMWPGYEKYLQRSGRQPRMFILERRKT